METLMSITLWNVVLLAGLFALQPLVRVITVGVTYALSNFDNRVDEVVLARRLAMVRSNQSEALSLWVPVVVIAALITPELAHPHLAPIAVVFLIARLAYSAVSLAGIPLFRSIAWLVGFAAWGYLTWIVMSAIAQ